MEMILIPAHNKCDVSVLSSLGFLFSPTEFISIYEQTGACPRGDCGPEGDAFEETANYKCRVTVLLCG